MKLSRILMVEDSEADQFLAKLLIEEVAPSIDIMQAYDGQQAIDILHATDKAVDIICLDINMPRMNGFEFLDKCEESLIEKGISVVMMTSSIRQEDKDKALSYQCVKQYFEKPFSSEFVAAFDQYVND